MKELQLHLNDLPLNFSNTIKILLMLYRKKYAGGIKIEMNGGNVTLLRLNKKVDLKEEIKEDLIN